MNAQFKTQITYALINNALKNSSCDSHLSKILKFILASYASSSSTKIFDFPHRNIDSIFTHNGLTFYISKIIINSHTLEDEHMDESTHRFALIFLPILLLAHSS